MQTTAIILAGGKSKRMGSDKALLKIDGQTLLERLIEKVKPLCQEVLISSNYETHNFFSYPVLEDEILNCGPIGGISTCLKHSKTDWNLVISVDAAYVEPDFLRFLISSVNDSDAIIPVWERGKEPLIGLYKGSCLSRMEQMIAQSDFKMHNLLKKLNIEYIDANKWVEKYPCLFHNLNRLTDLCSE